MRYFRVRNFEKYQHYKDRDPVWIKLYRGLLDDYAYCQLPDASKGHLVGIFLLAARVGNRIPEDPVWLQTRLFATEDINLQILYDARFIEEIAEGEQDASNVLAHPPTKEERREERDKKKEYETEFEDWWKEWPRREKKKYAKEKYIKLRLDGVSKEALWDGRDKYKSSVTVAKGFVQHAITWLNGEGWSDDYTPANEAQKKSDPEAARLEEERKQAASRIKSKKG